MKKNNYKKSKFAMFIAICALIVTMVFPNSPITKYINDYNNSSFEESADVGNNNYGDITINEENYDNNYEKLPNSDSQVVVVNNNKIRVNNSFISGLKNKDSYENYSKLDSLGRVGVADALIDINIMPTEKRQAINNIKPSGWVYNGNSNNDKYSFVENEWLYNRCHLIGFQLTGENANELNLMTGTRSFNTAMIPFENKVADYVRSGGKVYYKVTPVFSGENLLADGIYLEAKSVDSDAIEFCVFIRNIEEGVEIDYKTGQNQEERIGLIDNQSFFVLNNLQIITNSI